MKPLEAYRVISLSFNELHHFRASIYPNGQSYSHEEIEAQVIAFEALRRMEEQEKEKEN